MSYQVGQYRFEGKDSCLTDLTSSMKLGYRASDTSGGSFSDVMLRYDAGFNVDTDYYVKIKVPQDMNYDITFNVKLFKKSSLDTNEYQWLKQVSVQRSGSGTSSYRVVLYNKLDSSNIPCDPDDVAVGIPTEYSSSAKSTFNALYYDEANDKYYIGTSTGGYKDMDAIASPAQYNDMFITASWDSSFEDTDSDTYFEFVFRPLESGFTDLVLEMVRTSDDYNIKSHDSDGNTVYGRVVPTDQVTYEVAQLTDLMEVIGRSPFTKMGVWGHSGMIMAINGQEIKVGPSGFYELTAIPTKSLGIVAHDYSENFSVDYTYEVAD